MEFQIGELLSKAKLSLSVAESCTGGGLSSRICSVPGSSKYFIGGIIAYSIDSKIRDLGVRKEDIDTFSSVSQEIAKQMAIGARNRFNTDFSIAVTGYSGPDGDDVGKVFMSFSSIRGTVVHQFIFSGNRHEITDQAINTCLDILLSEIKLFICNGK